MRSYQIHFILKKPLVLEIGKLGRYEFPAGKYVYTGGAKRNMKVRISRHLSKRKKRRWHIDYLLATSHARIVRVELFDGEECMVNQETEGEILVPRFGAPLRTLKTLPGPWSEKLKTPDLIQLFWKI